MQTLLFKCLSVNWSILDKIQACESGYKVLEGGKGSTSEALFLQQSPAPGNVKNNNNNTQISRFSKEPSFNSNNFCTYIGNIPQSLDYLYEIPFISVLLILQIEYKRFQAIGIKIIHDCYVLGKMALSVLSSLFIIYWWNAWTLHVKKKQRTFSPQPNKVYIPFILFFKYIFIIYKILFHS